jgi:hypothetical protein
MDLKKNFYIKGDASSIMPSPDPVYAYSRILGQLPAVGCAKQTKK